MSAARSKGKEFNLLKEGVWVKTSGSRVRQPRFEPQLHSLSCCAGCVIWRSPHLCVRCPLPAVVSGVLVPCLPGACLLGITYWVLQLKSGAIWAIPLVPSASASPQWVFWAQQGHILAWFYDRSAITPSLFQRLPFHLCPSKPYCNGGQNLRKGRVSEAQGFPLPSHGVAPCLLTAVGGESLWTPDEVWGRSLPLLELCS